jgi:protein-disulfide isomerase
MEAGRGRPGVVKQQKQAAAMRPFYIALGAIAVAGAGFLVWQSSRQPEREVRTLDAATAGEVAANAEGWTYGKPDAPVTIVEFADYECPACARYATVTGPDVKRRIADAGLARIIFFDYPLPQHRFAVNASVAAACAGEQGKYWEMHDRLFEGQGEWSPQFTNVRNPKGIFEGYARDIGVDVGAWGTCYDDQKPLPRIRANAAEGQRRGINQTPSFVIGNRVLPGILTYDEIRAYVDSAARTAAPAPAPGTDSAGASGR